MSTKTDNVVIFPGAEGLQPVEVDKVLDGAKHLEFVVVLGWNDNNDLHFAASEADMPEILLMLELAKTKLIELYRGK